MPTVASIVERNKRHSDGAYIFLLEIALPSGTTIRLARNTEDLEWPTGSGTTWQALQFEFDDMVESAEGETRQLNFSVSNANRAILAYVEELVEWRKANGHELCAVRLVAVNTNLLAQAEPEGEWFFEDQEITSPPPMDKVIFAVGPENVDGRPVPARRVLRDHCQWETTAECPHVGTCDRNISTCRNIFANSGNFGGFPVVEQGGIYG